MELIHWDEALELHLPAMDAQHRHLVELLNELYEEWMTGTRRDHLQPLVERLSECMRDHLIQEEELMRTYNYPGLDVHKQQHEWLNDELARWMKDFHSGKSLLSPQSVRLLKDWLGEHINVADREMANYLHKMNGQP